MAEPCESSTGPSHAVAAAGETQTRIDDGLPEQPTAPRAAEHTDPASPERPPEPPASAVSEISEIEQLKRELEAARRAKAEAEARAEAAVAAARRPDARSEPAAEPASAQQGVPASVADAEEPAGRGPQAPPPDVQPLHEIPTVPTVAPAPELRSPSVFDGPPMESGGTEPVKPELVPRSSPRAHAPEVGSEGHPRRASGSPPAPAPSAAGQQPEPLPGAQVSLHSTVGMGQQPLPPIIGAPRRAHFVTTPARQLTQESVSIAQTLTASLSHPRRALTPSQEQQMRQNYLTVIQCPDWQRQLVNVAQEIVRRWEYGRSRNAPDLDSAWEVVVQYRGEMHPFVRQRAVTIGRNGGNDIKLAEDALSCSRLHCVFFVLPENGKILVADVGSCMGIEVVQRSSSAHCLSSKPLSRLPIILDWGETAVLQLAEETITVNPKECIVCSFAPRAVTYLPCGHFCCCANCDRNQDSCPICRQPIYARRNSEAAHTLAVPPGTEIGPVRAEQPERPSGPMEKWGQEDVDAWLCALGVSADTRKVFRRNGIRGDVMESVTDDLLKEMGVSVIGDRLRIKRDLADRTAAAAAQAPAAN